MKKPTMPILVYFLLSITPAFSENWKIIETSLDDLDNNTTHLEKKATIISESNDAALSVFCAEGTPLILVEEVGQDYGYREEPAMLSFSTDNQTLNFNLASISGGVYVAGDGLDIAAVIDEMRQTTGLIEVLAMSSSDIEIRANFSAHGSNVAISSALRDCIDNLPTINNFDHLVDSDNLVTNRAINAGAIRYSTNTRLEAVVRFAGYSNWEKIIEEDQIWHIINARRSDGSKYDLVVQKNRLEIIDVSPR